MPAHKLTTDSERFYTKVGSVNSNGCRLWLGSIAIDRGGYGMIGTGSRAEGTFQNRRANRFALELALGRPLRSGMFALHTCDITACVCTDGDGTYEINGIFRSRRGHLWEGTCEDNVADRTNKYRSATGDKNGGQKRLSKLSSDQVFLIRSKHAAGKSYQELADEFGVCYGTIYYIVLRKSWRHI
jgi:hypothetical protein